MKIKILFLAGFLIAGCNVVESKGGNSYVNLTNNNPKCIRVYTLGNVVNAVVTDKEGQVAEYNATTSQYCFNSPLTYPVSAKVIDSTYIDVDYDNNKTANDIKPKFTQLKSYYPYVDLITDMHARAVDENLSLESNISNTLLTIQEVIDFYNQNIKDKYNIDLNDLSNENENILNFVAYDYNLTNNLSINVDLLNFFNNLAIFFNNYLNKPTILDKVKYYSFYHSLELLDKKLIQRIDTLHKPNITYLHPTNLPITNLYTSYLNNIIAKDIKIDENNSFIYVASGVDGVTKLDINLSKKLDNKKVNDTFSNSYEVNILDINATTNYLLVADGGEGIDIFDILNGQFQYLDKIFWKYYDVQQEQNISITIDNSNGLHQIDSVNSLNTYLSPQGNTIWLAFGTDNNGLYLVDFRKIIPNIKSLNQYPMIIYDPDNDENNTLWIKGDGGSVYSEAFSRNGENLYATKNNVIERYNLSSLPITLGGTYTIRGDNAYKLKMINSNGVDELFVSTNKGVEIYDVLNNYDLNFVSSYSTEGAQNGYLPKMSFISEKNILLFTDGYKGLKAIKYDSSFNPNLCGGGYFSTLNDKTKLAKVTSVEAYKNNTNGEYYVIVGIDGFGVAEFKLNDLLFKHCQ